LTGVFAAFESDEDQLTRRRDKQPAARDLGAVDCGLRYDGSLTGVFAAFESDEDQLTSQRSMNIMTLIEITKISDEDH
jgi:hypothetical protein